MLSGLFAFFSLPLLLFGSITVESNICEIPTTPVIITPAANSTLSSQTAIVSGTTTASSTVAITDNSQPAANVMSDVNGDFEVQITLAVGQNQLTAQTSNPCGTSGITSETVTVVLPVAPPPTSPPSSGGSPSTSSGSTGVKSVTSGSSSAASSPSSVSSSPTPAVTTPSSGGTLTLFITSPADHLTTSKASIFVTGTTGVSATETITVNGIKVASLDDVSTTFGVGVPLKIGDNVIRITATANGSTTSKEIHITRIRFQPLTTPWYTWMWVWVAAVALFIVALLCIILLGKKRQQQ